jgi:hypothetical protein
MRLHFAYSEGIMILPEWVARWIGRRAPEPEPRHMPAAPPPSRRRMSGEYQALHTYLDARYARTVVLTFQQMEALLGFPLPQSARSDATWWTTAAGTADVRYQDAWKLADRTAAPNLMARTVIFERGSD